MKLRREVGKQHLHYGIVGVTYDGWPGMCEWIGVILAAVRSRSTHSFAVSAATLCRVHTVSRNCGRWPALSE